MKGFTLVEALISVLLSAIAMVFIASIWTSSIQLNRTSELQAQSEKEKWHAEALIRGAFLQAIDITYAGSTDLVTYQGGSGSSGKIRDFDSDTYWLEPTSKTYTIAVFHRDEGRSASTVSELANAKSQFHLTALYFQKPTAKKWGALYLDLGRLREPGASLALSQVNGVKLEGLTRLRILNVKTHNLSSSASMPLQPVIAFDLEMTFRKYIAYQGKDDLMFCPASQITTTGPCSTTVPYRDQVKTLRLVVRNNVLGVSPTAIIPSGTLPASPTTYGARVYDRIHFFKPKILRGVM